RPVLQPALLRRAPKRGLPALAWRHVLPRRLHRLRPGCDPIRAQTRLADSFARRHLLRGWTDWALPRPYRQFHQWRTLGPSDRRALGHGVSRRRTAAAPPESAL